MKTNQNNAILGRSAGTQNFTNAASGVIDVQAGTLYLDNKEPEPTRGHYHGDQHRAWFRNGAHSFQAGASIGSGSSLVLGNSTASVTFAEPVSFEALTITNGTLANNANVTVNTLNQANGVVTGSGNLIVKNTGHVRDRLLTKVPAPRSLIPGPPCPMTRSSTWSRVAGLSCGARPTRVVTVTTGLVAVWAPRL